MNLAEAESILALDAELATSLELRHDEGAFRNDWRVQFAAERVIERVFQATEAIGPEARERYFGADGVRYLRGIRNRLSHNYLAIDHDILWDTITVDLPLVSNRVASDAALAKQVLAAAMKSAAEDKTGWRKAHLRSTRDDE